MRREHGRAWAWGATARRATPRRGALDQRARSPRVRGGRRQGRVGEVPRPAGVRGAATRRRRGGGPHRAGHRPTGGHRNALPAASAEVVAPSRSRQGDVSGAEGLSLPSVKCSGVDERASGANCGKGGRAVRGRPRGTAGGFARDRTVGCGGPGDGPVRPARGRRHRCAHGPGVPGGVLASGVPGHGRARRPLGRRPPHPPDALAVPARRDERPAARRDRRPRESADHRQRGHPRAGCRRLRGDAAHRRGRTRARLAVRARHPSPGVDHPGAGAAPGPGRGLQRGAAAADRLAPP